MSSTPRRGGHAILAQSRNCWAAPHAHTACLLVDARNYYRAFHQVASNARRYLLLAGWHFTSDVRLLRGRDAASAGGEVRLLQFLAGLCKANPELRVHVLAWSYSFNYGLEWEWHQKRRFERAHPKIRFQWDGNHSVGASHHQKVVVADGSVAFVGGLDFSSGSWDDRRHRARHSERVDGDKPHGPYHDVQACMTGPAAGEVARYFQRRWRQASGKSLDLPAPPPDAPVELPAGLSLPAGRVALSRTEPKTLTDPEDVREVRQLYLDAIAAADDLVYLENQYFSSRAIAGALLDRMAAPGRRPLDIVLILPRQLPSWVEAAAMGPPRIRLLDDLRESARRHGHRLGIYYTAAPAAEGEVPVTIHSKVLIVDDRFLTVGSANASNRSMGLDTELNVTWEATASEERPLRLAIRRVRMSLLAEHCGLRRAARRVLRRRRGLVPLLDRLAADSRSRLRPLTNEAIFEDRDWLRTLTRWGFAFDPDRPAIEETAYETLMPADGSLLGRAASWLMQLTRRTPMGRVEEA